MLESESFMDFPPSKRLRGQQGSAAPDPFDDDIDFTQDDLDQMDILASQAITAVQSSGSKRAFGSDETSTAPVRSSRTTFALGHTHNNTHRRDAIADGHSSKDGEDLKQLEEQQADLKKRLKEVEEEILMKNGEIRVLRDSLKLANQEKEQQRQTQLALEKERAQAQSEREKELCRKVQSLQSELHFKEAEINEMRGKLHSAERGGKTPNTVRSPRAFMTKENFSAELSRKSSPLQKDGKPAQEQSLRPDHQQEGCVLLNLLLQQPLDPSALGLCHLLSIGPAALPNALSQSLGSLATSSSSSTELRSIPRAPAGFVQLQSLAVSALTALTLQPSRGAPHLHSCPSAVHFLPLLSAHISSFCESLESVESSKASLRGSLSGSWDCSSALEESLSGQEELALAAMTALHHIVCYSREALAAVLCHPDARPQGSAPGEPPLLLRLLQLADPAFITAAVQREALLNTSLKTLGMIAEKAQENQLLRLQVVLSSPVLSKCLTLETPYRTVHLSLRLLALIIYNQEMATKLCAHECPCPLLKIFQYVTSRPDKSTAEDPWSRLELEVIRFLTKLFTQKTETWAAFCESACQCVNEVVRTVIVLLHRQWLSTRGRAALRTGAGVRPGSQVMRPGSQVLREALMFLHWRLLKDSAFSEHCLDVLHMYDQVIPAIRDTFRLIPDLSESEELALEEICRSEAEDTEDMDVETGS